MEKIPEKRRTVLIVDDDPEIRRQLKWSLMDDFDLLVAADPREVESLLLRGERPAAAIVDLHLPPDPSGIEGGISIIRSLRKRSGATRIIVLSADETDGARRRSRAAGAETILNKPVNSTRVREALKSSGGLS